MAGGAQTRSVVLFGALAATLAATAWVAGRGETPDDFGPVARAALPQRDQEPQSGAESAAPPGPPAADGASIDLARLKREIVPPAQAAPPVDDAFARHSWYVPPPPPKAAPAPRPVAPELPFTFMGRFTEGGKEVVFITNRQDRNYVVAEGDTIEGSYRVESITERAMTLTYLPLGQQQTLALPQYLSDNRTNPCGNPQFKPPCSPH